MLKVDEVLVIINVFGIFKQFRFISFIFFIYFGFYFWISRKSRDFQFQWIFRDLLKKSHRTGIFLNKIKNLTKSHLCLDFPFHPVLLQDRSDRVDQHQEDQQVQEAQVARVAHSCHQDPHDLLARKDQLIRAVPDIPDSQMDL